MNVGMVCYVCNETREPNNVDSLHMLSEPQSDTQKTAPKAKFEKTHSIFSFRFVSKTKTKITEKPKKLRGCTRIIRMCQITDVL